MEEVEPTEEDQQMMEEMIPEILVLGIVQLLKQDEGIIIHHGEEGEERGFVIYNNSEELTLKIMEDDKYLGYEHGRLIWMHYEGSKAPDAAFDEEVMGESEGATKH